MHTEWVTCAVLDCLSFLSICSVYTSNTPARHCSNFAEFLVTHAQIEHWQTLFVKQDLISPLKCVHNTKTAINVGFTEKNKWLNSSVTSWCCLHICMLLYVDEFGTYFIAHVIVPHQGWQHSTEVAIIRKIRGALQHLLYFYVSSKIHSSPKYSALIGCIWIKQFIDHSII